MSTQCIFLLVRSFIDPTFCGIFICGLNVNRLLIFWGRRSFIDPICCSFLHAFGHVSGDHSSRSRRTTIFFEKSPVTRKNGLCSQLNAAEKYHTMGPMKLLRHLEVIIINFVFFFTEKIKQNRKKNGNIQPGPEKQYSCKEKECKMQAVWLHLKCFIFFLFIRLAVAQLLTENWYLHCQ